MTLLFIVIAYLLGTIPTAYIAGRLKKGVDIRQVGDGNMGAGNAFHHLGPKTGCTVGILDAVKGVLAISLAQAASLPEAAVLLAGVAAVVGHNWPIFLNFRGGRGEATTIGILLVLVTQPILITGAFAAAVLIRSKKVPLASAVLFIPLPFICWWLGISGALIVFSIGLPCLVGITHYIKTRQEAPLPVQNHAKE
jgi:acyl phosphate:glycerol-3-phosphate acyltransferase